MLKSALQYIKDNDPAILNTLSLYEKNQLKIMEFDVNQIAADGLTPFNMSTLLEDYRDFRIPYTGEHVPTDKIWYHNGSEPLPQINDRVFMDSQGLIRAPYSVQISGNAGDPGLGNHYYLGLVDYPSISGLDEYYILIGTDGTVNDIGTAAIFDMGG